MKKLNCFLLFCLLSSVSCSFWDDETSSGFNNGIESLSHDMIILGEKLDDPYSVKNIQAAVEQLYPTKAQRFDVRATDIYVRFLPENDEQCRRLENLGVELLDHPLDYEIVKEGDYYHDPELPDDHITWQYAVLDPGFIFPSGIKYEILDECYIPGNNDAKTRAAYDWIDWDAVERQAYIISGNEDKLTPVTKSESGNPSGRITIIDDKFNGGEPFGVMGVRISCNSFVKFASAYTDADGYYTISKNFNSDIRYRLVFQNRKGFAIGMNLLLVPASMSTLGKNPSSGVSVCISKDSDRKLFSRCVVNNAAYDYYSRCASAEFGVFAPPSNLRLWLFQNIRNSSTPMLQQGAVVDSELLAPYLGDYRELVKKFLPDITLGLKDMDDYASIYAAAIHELAHSSHFRQVGKDYWNKYIEFILKSFVLSGWEVYGTGTEDNAGYCEIGEMWGYFIANRFFKERYGAYMNSLGTAHWFYPQVFLYLDERGFGPGLIFSGMTQAAISRDSLEEILVSMYPEEREMIEEAFGRYSN